MIYVVGRQEFYDNDRLYTLFESNTESFFTGHKDDLRLLITKHQVSLRHVYLLNDEITGKVWYDNIHCKKGDTNNGTNYILICKTDAGMFKLASYDEKVSYVNNEQLRQYIKEYKVANCEIENGRLKSTGTYKIVKAIEFESQIAEKYKIYEAKTLMMGHDMSFDYTIEGREVKLTKYTGRTKDVIVPKFVTTIMEEAFIGCELSTVKLDNGLKYIGNSAFERCNLEEIIIPETVEFVGRGAFYQNRKLLTVGGLYRRDRIKVLSRATTILDMPHKAKGSDIEISNRAISKIF